MSFNILYSSDPELDLISLLRYINNFTDNLGEKEVELDVDKCMAILRLIRQDFPHKDGLSEANVFKKVAYFMCYFIGERPVLSTFSAENVGAELAGMINHQNAMIALQIAIDSLHGAVVRANSETPNELKNRIQLSAHSYRDIVDAIKTSSPVSDFKLLCVLLEQLVYKTNPDCQYTLIDI